MSNSPGKNEGRPQRPAPWDEESGSSSAPVRNLPDSSRVQTSSVEEWMKMPHNTLGSDKGIQTDVAKASRSMEYVDVIYNFNKIDASMKEIVPDEVENVDDDMKGNENVEIDTNVSERAKESELTEPNEIEINPENISETPIDKGEMSSSSVPGSQVMATTGDEQQDTPYPVDEDRLLRESVQEFLKMETGPIKIFNMELENAEIKELQAENPQDFDEYNRQSEEVNVESTPNISDAASETGVQPNVVKDEYELAATLTVEDKVQSEKEYDEFLTDIVTKVETGEGSEDIQQEIIRASTFTSKTGSQTEEITDASVSDVDITSKTGEQSENMNDECLHKDVADYCSKTQPEEKVAEVSDDSKISEASFHQQKDECLHEETVTYETSVEFLEQEDNSSTPDKELEEGGTITEVTVTSEETTVQPEVIDDKSTIDEVKFEETSARPEEVEGESVTHDSIAENENKAQNKEKKSESIFDFPLTSEDSTVPTEMWEHQSMTDENNKKLEEIKGESIDDVPETSKEASASTRGFEEKSISDTTNNEKTDNLSLHDIAVSINITSAQDEDIKNVSMTDVGKCPDKTQTEKMEGKSIFDIDEPQNEDTKDDRNVISFKSSELESHMPDPEKNSDKNGAQIKDIEETSICHAEETSVKTDIQTEIGVTADETSSLPTETKDITKQDVALTPDDACSQPEHISFANENRSAEAGTSQATIGQVGDAVQGVEPPLSSTEASVSRLRRTRKRSSSQSAETNTPKRRSPRIPRYPDRLEYHRKGQC